MMNKWLSLTIAVSLTSTGVWAVWPSTAVAAQFRLLTVSQTPGAAEFTSIQPALDAASAGDTVEIIDDRVYNENLSIPQSKTGLILRAQEGRVPILMGAGPHIIEISGTEGLTIQGLAVKGVPGTTGDGLVAAGERVKSLTIRNCRFEAIAGTGIVLDDGDTAEIVGCTFQNLGGAGIDLKAGVEATIRRNAFRGGTMNTSASDGLRLVASSGLIEANQFVGLGRFGIGTFTQAEGSPQHQSAISIVNNLIVSSGQKNPEKGDGMQIVGSLNTINRLKIVNNTIVKSAHFGIGFGFQTGDTQSQAALSNNIVMGSGANGMAVSDLAIYSDSMVSPTRTLAQTSVAFCLIGNDQVFGTLDRNGNLTGDPKFKDPAIGNYRLTEGSLAVDAGDDTAIEDFQYDLDGANRLLDGDHDAKPRVDLGPYEYDYDAGG